MNENDFKLLIQTVLDKSGAQKNISDLQDFLNKNVIKIIPQLDSSTLKNNLKTISGDLAKALNSQFGTNISKNDVFKLLNQQLNNASKSSRKLVTDLQKITQVNTIKTWASNNTKALKQNEAAINSMVSKLSSIDDMTRDDFNNLKQQFKEIQVHARETGNLGLTFGEKLNNAWSKFGGWTLASSSLMFAVSKTKEAVSELKEVDTLLTEISKANDKLSKSQLKEIGSSSFGTSSKYGKKAPDYLSGVQEASRAGYQNAKDIAELSVAIQGAGDVTDETANKYVIATDKAYKLGGSIEKLTKIFDGSNYITNHNAVNMTELAEGMTIVGSTAASLGVDVNETTAALGTMSATTQQSGSEVARAFRAILLNIRQISDEEEGVDAEGLTKYEKACNALNVKLKETKNGVQSLRDPMTVLKELSEEYNKLDESDIKRTNLLNSVGGKVYHVIQKCMTRMNLIAGNPLEPCTTI